MLITLILRPIKKVDSNVYDQEYGYTENVNNDCPTEAETDNIGDDMALFYLESNDPVGHDPDLEHKHVQGHVTTDYNNLGLNRASK